MSIFPDGSIVRSTNQAEVWRIENGLKRWIPDPETLATLGGWAAVQVTPSTVDNPVGPLHQSVRIPNPWRDGSLVAAWPADPRVWVMDSGTLRWIPDPETFNHYHYDWATVAVISDDTRDAIQRGKDLDSVLSADRTRWVVATGRKSLDAGHFMDTRAGLNTLTGMLTGSTTTETTTLFGGFHGVVYMILSDSDDVPIPGGGSPRFRYGIDGKALGPGTRTDAWSWSVDPAEAKRVAYFRVYHSWSPDEFEVILDKWVRSGDKVAKLSAAVTAVGKVFEGAPAQAQNAKPVPQPVK